MTIAEYFVIFIFFSVVGWLFECIYCTVNEHHWQNRGFLHGPLCPIYGTGIVAAMFVFTQLLSSSAEEGASWPVWQVFLICAAGSAVLEFTTSWALEKKFHAVWWDYSNIPLNIQGRICLPATCGFGIAGVVFVKLVFPLIEKLPVSGHPMISEALSIVLAILLGMDLALTVESLTRLTQRMEDAEDRFNERMEEGVQIIRQGPEAVSDAVRAQAKDVRETAAITAMVAADAAKERLSGRDKYHLRSIKFYRPQPKKKDVPEMPENLKKFFEEMQKSAGKPKKRK